jgi:outer membrane protein insertion porin family
MKKIVLFWILVSAFLFAQRVTHIKFEGLAHYSASTAKEMTGIHIGEEIDANKINESIKNFFSEGYFKDVWVDRQGGTLIYHFEEKMAIANIDIKGYGTGNDGKELLQGLGLKKGDLYDSRRAAKAKQTLISNLEKRGYYDTIVEMIVNPVSDNSVSVMFDVNKGEKIIIRKMNFIGANNLSQSDLEINLANREEDFLGWMPWRNNGEANVDQLEYDTFRVKETYMQHGYLDVQVSKPLMRVDSGSYSAEIDYQINEGIQYRVGSVSISQNIEGLNTAVLADELRLLTGKIFNIKRMRKDIKLLEEEVGNYGYAYARVSPQMSKNPQTKTINLQYVVNQGQPVTINDVIISGNDATKDRVIRRYLYLAPGDKFNARDLKDSKSALGRTGFFEGVDVHSQRISENKVNLLVKVKETATGSISAGGGYGSYEGAMLNASYSEKNAFGSGISTSIGFDVSDRSQNYNLSFANPKLWDSQNSLSLSLYKKNYEYSSFTLDQRGASLYLGREFMRHFRVAVGVGYMDNQSESNNNEQEDQSFFNETIAPTDRVKELFYADKYEKVSLFTSLSFDNTDDFYIPREGMLASVSLEFASLTGQLEDSDLELTPGGYGKFTRTAAKLGLYYGLEDWIDYDLILRFKGRVATIASADGNKLPIAEKLFMGGIGSVRGYERYSLTPRVDGLQSGGKKRASVSLEASVPLSKAAKMRLAGFYDYGMLGENSFGEIKRSSVGVVLEWHSAFGPINLVFAKALDDEEGDRTSKFEFSMGTKF